MRVNLVSHPKVLALAEILSGDGEYQEWSTMAGFVPSIGGSCDDSERDYQASLRVTRYVTVCALLRFWGYANEHAKDEFIGSLRLHDIDDVVQVPGFGAALHAIGWAEYDAERRGLSLPNFNEYNTSGNERSAGAKSAAQRQKEYRDRKKAQESDVTRNDESDVTRNRREEKRREEKKEESLSAAADKKTSRKSQVPADFQPNDAGTEAAESAGLDVKTEVRKFIDFHEGKGSVMANWQAAWRTWVGKAIEFGRGKPAKPSGEAAWLAGTPFTDTFEAHNAGCFSHNVAKFRTGAPA